MHGIRKRLFSSYEPLTEDDIDDFDSLDLEDLSKEDLEDLLDKVEELQVNLEDKEPEDTESEDHDLWEDRISEVEDFADRIQERLDDLEDEENYIVVDDDFQTSCKGVFAGGDCIPKKVRQVVTAVSDGAIIAKNVAKYLQ